MASYTVKTVGIREIVVIAVHSQIPIPDLNLGSGNGMIPASHWGSVFLDEATGQNCLFEFFPLLSDAFLFLTRVVWW